MAYEPFIHDYVRQLLARAWKDARRFRAHLGIELVLLAAACIVEGLVWKSDAARLATIGMASVLMFAGQIVPAAAAMHRDSLAKVKDLESKAQAYQSATSQHLQPDAVPYDSLGWREVIVCLVDVSGFNPFFVGTHDNDLYRILLDLDTALAEARLTTLGSVSEDSALQKAVVPSARRILIKPIGGRAMLVWEYPIDDQARMRVETELALLIVDFLGHLQRKFYADMEALGRRRVVPNDPLRGLRLSIALSCGKAWKRVSAFGNTLVDYAGLPVNEATQLLQQALPFGGFVASLHLEPYLFMERLCARQGRIEHTFLAQTNNVISFWVLEGRQVILKRRAKGDLLKDLKKACAWLRDPYPSVSGSVPLGEDDAMFVFELRETWEPRFASDLAQRVHQKGVSGAELDSIELTIAEMGTMLQSGEPVVETKEWSDLGLAFHSKIAEFSDLNESRERTTFVEEIYKLTLPVYAYATSDPSLVLKQHREIFEAIKAGDPGAAGELVESHLRDHYGRAKDALLRTNGL